MNDKIKNIIKAAAVPSGITAIMLTLMFFPAFSAALELRLDRVFYLPSWLTCHLVHYSWRHFAFDAAVFQILGTVVVLQGGMRRLLAVCAAALLAVPLAVPLLSPELTAYRGVSGIDTALVAAAAVHLLKDRVLPVRMAAVAVLAGILLKSCFEYQSGLCLFAGVDIFEPVASAHVAGMLSGGAATAAAIIKLKTKVLQ